MRTTDPPSRRSGSAFCTVKSTPFTLVPKMRSKCSSVIEPSGSMSPPPALAKTMSRRSASRDLRIDAVEVVELRGVGADAGGAVADRCDRRVQLGLPAAGDEDPGPACGELTRRSQADAGAAA